jgi:hypothetical protein
VTLDFQFCRLHATRRKSRPNGAPRHAPQRSSSGGEASCENRRWLQARSGDFGVELACLHFHGGIRCALGRMIGDAGEHVAHPAGFRLQVEVNASFDRISSRSARFVTSAPIASRPTSWCAFLAFVLWKTLRCGRAAQGLGNSPRTVLGEPARIQSHDVVLPTASHGQNPVAPRHATDAAQAALLDRLGTTLPKSMRLAEREMPAFAASA